MAAGEWGFSVWEVLWQVQEAVKSEGVHGRNQRAGRGAGQDTKERNRKEGDLSWKAGKQEREFIQGPRFKVGVGGAPSLLPSNHAEGFMYIV